MPLHGASNVPRSGARYAQNGRLSGPRTLCGARRARDELRCNGGKIVETMQIVGRLGNPCMWNGERGKRRLEYRGFGRGFGDRVVPALAQPTRGRTFTEDGSVSRNGRM